jgi:aldehyde:ferredoxin oxidoreductase
MIAMVKRIGERQGLGNLLGEGVKRAAERIGGLAIEYAMHVKGLELPAHEPRAANGTALGYATGSIGAAHMEASGSQNLENWLEVAHPLTLPELGFTTALNRFDNQGKGAIVAKTQDFGCLLDSITVCLFLSLHQWVMPSHYTAMLRQAVGWDMEPEEFMAAGERIFNLKRMFSVRRGISRKDDTLPPRILTLPLTEGGSRGNLPFLGLMLHEYYTARGWSEEGIPTREKLLALNLRECLE